MTALSTYSSHHPVLHSSSPTVIVSCRGPYLVLDIEKVQTMLQEMHSFRYLIDSLFNYRCVDVSRPALTSWRPAQQGPALRPALNSWRPALKVQLSQHSSTRPAVDQLNSDQLFTRRHLRKATPGLGIYKDNTVNDQLFHVVVYRGKRHRLVKGG